MAAYVIFVRDEPVHDPVEMEAYIKTATSNPQSFKSTPLSMYKPVETLEGKPADGIVLVQFPSLEEAKAWYHSPGYQAATVHRKKAANYRVMLVEGI